MSNVVMDVKMPAEIWMQKPPKVTESGNVRYFPEFRRESKTSSPVHLGPTVQVAVVDDKGNVLSMESAQVTITSSGRIQLRTYRSAVPDFQKEAEDA